jgi:hypothetical protein
MFLSLLRLTYNQSSVRRSILFHVHVSTQVVVNSTHNYMNAICNHDDQPSYNAHCCMNQLSTSVGRWSPKALKSWIISLWNHIFQQLKRFFYSLCTPKMGKKLSNMVIEMVFNIFARTNKNEMVYFDYISYKSRAHITYPKHILGIKP